MPLGTGLAFSAAGALVGAIVWVVLIQLTGWSLWILAPLVGGAAGFGMMRGTRMTGGLAAGVAAGTMTLLAIFFARHFVVSHAVQDLLAVDESAAIESIASDVAGELQERDIEPYDDDGDFTSGVYAKASARWEAMSFEDQQDYVAALQGESDAAQTVLTPLALVFDFGLFGTLCTLLSIGSAFKTGSITLERALIQDGHAMGPSDAASMASTLRADDGPTPHDEAAPASRWTVPLPPAEESDIPPLQPQGDAAFAAAGRAAQAGASDRSAA